MTWRLGYNTIDGLLDNSTEGSVTGHIRFAREVLDDEECNPLAMESLEVHLDLLGNLPDYLKGTSVCLLNRAVCDEAPGMVDFSETQTGTLKDSELDDDSLYLEWDSEEDGRVQVALDAGWILHTVAPPLLVS